MRGPSRRTGLHAFEAVFVLVAGATVVCSAEAAVTGLAGGPRKNSADIAHFKTLANTDSNSTAPAEPAAVVKCTESARCQLEIGKAFGDPWVKAEAAQVNYFEVRQAIIPPITVLVYIFYVLQESQT